jgi:hypothetical protein
VRSRNLKKKYDVLGIFWLLLHGNYNIVIFSVVKLTHVPWEATRRLSTYERYFGVSIVIFFGGFSVVVLGTGFVCGTSYVFSGLHCLTSQKMFRNYSCWLNMNSLILMRIQN